MGFLFEKLLMSFFVYLIKIFKIISLILSFLVSFLVVENVYELEEIKVKVVYVKIF